MFVLQSPSVDSKARRHTSDASTAGPGEMSCLGRGFDVKVVSLGSLGFRILGYRNVKMCFTGFQTDCV